MKISVCLATYQRPAKLARLLHDLLAQEVLPAEIIIVDNDPGGSARPVFEQCQERGSPVSLHYSIQPIKNISITRNWTVAFARFDWIAFIDDDEHAPTDWLRRLSECAVQFDADCILGPVIPVLPATAPAWIRAGSFYDWSRTTTGTPIALNKLRFGNVLMRAAWLRDRPAPFDPAYGLTGGEDGDILSRLVRKGMRAVWCDEAVVYEPVEADRLSFAWLVLRALRGGQNFGRHTLKGRFGPISAFGRARFFFQALVQAGLAALLALLFLPCGRHRAAFWLLKLSANLGKLSILAGARYHEYGGPRT